MNGGQFGNPWDAMMYGASESAAGEVCADFAALGLTRETWAALDEAAQRDLVTRYLIALGSENTPEQLAADVAALPDAAARLAYLEAKTGCTVPAGGAPGGGGGGGGFVGGAVSTEGGGATVISDEAARRAEELKRAADEAERNPTRYVLTQAPTRKRGGVLLVLAALALALTSGRSRRK